MFRYVCLFALAGLFLCVVYTPSFAQKNAQELVKAEKNFEKDCLEKGIRSGFLINLDSFAITFSEGRPVSAFEFWESQPETEGVFLWGPSYAEMSVGENWGYTTGSYHYLPKSLTDSAVDFGQYTTIWRKNAASDWKYQLDIGNAHKKTPIATETEFIAPKKSSAKNAAQSSLARELEFHKTKTTVEKSEFYSENFILNFNGHMPIVNWDTAKDVLASIESISYQLSGTFQAPAGDMVAIYGTAMLEDNSGVFVRIWRFENKDWKIALEVLNL